MLTSLPNRWCWDHFLTTLQMLRSLSNRCWDHFLRQYEYTANTHQVSCAEFIIIRNDSLHQVKVKSNITEEFTEIMVSYTYNNMPTFEYQNSFNKYGFFKLSNSKNLEKRFFLYINRGQSGLIVSVSKTFKKYLGLRL